MHGERARAFGNVSRRGQIIEQVLKQQKATPPRRVDGLVKLMSHQAPGPAGFCRERAQASARVVPAQLLIGHKYLLISFSSSPDPPVWECGI
jgi:hypothetical protein